jgi:hypothetical protein
MPGGRGTISDDQCCSVGTEILSSNRLMICAQAATAATRAISTVVTSAAADGARRSWPAARRSPRQKPYAAVNTTPQSTVSRQQRSGAVPAIPVRKARTALTATASDVRRQARAVRSTQDRTGEHRRRRSDPCQEGPFMGQGETVIRFLATALPARPLGDQATLGLRCGVRIGRGPTLILIRWTDCELSLVMAGRQRCLRTGVD